MKELTTIQKYALEQLCKERKISAENLEAAFCKALVIEQVDVIISNLISYYPGKKVENTIKLKIVNNGCNRVKLISAVKRLCNISVSEAKEAVDNETPIQISAENGKYIINALTCKFGSSLTLLIE